ncbi:MAG: rod shape-determining protein RodA [Candidatus Hydrothermota bacterium]|nr:MAG: rod shape-determining protein RodA [Candidatus Hydrothermae bacterium]
MAKSKEFRAELLKFVLIPLILYVIGLLELYSIKEFYFWRQLVWGLLAISLGFLIYHIPTDIFDVLSVPIYIFSMLTLVVVLGVPQAGPKRWIRVAGFNLQPSEFAKVALILMLAKLFDRKRINRQLFKAALASIVPFGLVLIEPDLGTAGTFGLLFMGIAYLAGVDSRPIALILTALFSALASFSPTLFVLLLVGIIAVSRVLRYPVSFAILLFFTSIIIGLITPVIWEQGLHEYQRKRIIAFFNPEKYQKGIGWQIVQARIALGSGGLFGKGFRKGTQKGLAFLPAAHTDFIFSSIGEEFGFMATVLIIVAFAVWISLVLGTSSKFTNRFRKILGYGVALNIAFHAAINIASNIGFFPVVGLPLPFITYGGSHLLVEAAMIALFLRALKEESE